MIINLRLELLNRNERGEMSTELCLLRSKFFSSYFLTSLYVLKILRYLSYILKNRLDKSLLFRSIIDIIFGIFEAV